MGEILCKNFLDTEIAQAEQYLFPDDEESGRMEVNKHVTEPSYS